MLVAMQRFLKVTNLNDEVSIQLHVHMEVVSDVPCILVRF